MANPTKFPSLMSIRIRPITTQRRPGLSDTAIPKSNNSNDSDLLRIGRVPMLGFPMTGLRRA